MLVCADGSTSRLATQLGYCTEAPQVGCGWGLWLQASIGLCPARHEPVLLPAPSSCCQRRALHCARWRPSPLHNTPCAGRVLAGLHRGGQPQRKL